MIYFFFYSVVVNEIKSFYFTVEINVSIFQESIMECRVDSEKKFKPLLFLARIVANAIILAMLAFSIYTISFAVETSETVEKTGSLFTKNQVSFF